MHRLCQEREADIGGDGQDVQSVEGRTIGGQGLERRDGTGRDGTGRDGTRRAHACACFLFFSLPRFLQIPEETHLVFKGGHGSSIDSVCLLTPNVWLSGSQDGSLALWSIDRRRPVILVRGAHRRSEDESIGACGAWVSAVANASGTDLCASGAGDGWIRLWKCQIRERGQCVFKSSESIRLALVLVLPQANPSSDPTLPQQQQQQQQPSPRLSPLPVAIPALGFVNALDLSADGRLLVAAMGQEPRLGRWAREKRAKNGLLTVRLRGEQQGEAGGEE